MDTSVVNLWRGELCASPDVYDRYWQWLDIREKKRAESFGNEKLRQRYVEVRGRLRLTLGQWLNAPPEEILIELTQHGKPFLADYPGHVFNISHSANFLAIAAGRNMLLGVDIEQCRPRTNLAGMVNKCFAEAEIAHWLKLAEPDRLSQFYGVWTIKEAFVKATGLGIKSGLQHCVVNPEDMKAFISIPGKFGNSADWHIMRLELDRPMLGAIVFKNLSKVNKTRELAVHALPAV